METVAVPQRELRIKWLNAGFLIGIPPLALAAAIWHGMTYGVGWLEFGLFFFMYYACGLSITAGYHRLFSHRSHEARAPLRMLYALFGAGAFENSVLEWCSDHRHHHRDTDGNDDPYSATEGFWWSHFIWVIMKDVDDATDFSNVRDLEKDWILRFQHRHIFLIGFLVGMVLPAAIGYAIGGIGGGIGGFVWGGLVRTVWVHHGTFLINSAAHVWGKQPYSDRNTSRDNPYLAFFTFGEGYHNFHHEFQADYRNGHRWWQFDPTKWWIRAWSFVGLNRNLKRAPKWSIEVAKMDMAYKVAVLTQAGSESLEEFNSRAKDSRQAVKAAWREIDRLKTARKEATEVKRDQLRARIRVAKASLKRVRADFMLLLQDMRLSSTPAVA